METIRSRKFSLSSMSSQIDLICRTSQSSSREIDQKERSPHSERDGSWRMEEDEWGDARLEGTWNSSRFIIKFIDILYQWISSTCISVTLQASPLKLQTSTIIIASSQNSTSQIKPSNQSSNQKRRNCSFLVFACATGCTCSSLQSIIKMCISNLIFQINFQNYSFIQVKQHMAMTQDQINDLLKQSMFQESEDLGLTHSQKQAPSQNQADHYTEDEFESYEESKNNLPQNKTLHSNNSLHSNHPQPQINKAPLQNQKHLSSIQQQNINHDSPTKNQFATTLQEKKFAQTGIYFKKEKKYSPVKKDQSRNTNINRMQDRQKELLITTLREENRELKDRIHETEKQSKNIDMAYKLLMQENAKRNPSVKEATLEKQITILQNKYDKLFNLQKVNLEERKIHLTSHSKTTVLKGNLILEQEANRRELELMEVIDKLKERLISTDKQLKTLQARMNQGLHYNEELQRKLKRVEQLELRIEKMNYQAQIERDLIDTLKEKNKEMERVLNQERKDMKSLQVQVKVMEMGQLTHKDIMEELKETRRAKELLEKSLKDLSSNLMRKVKNMEHVNMEDSNELLRAD